MKKELQDLAAARKALLSLNAETGEITESAEGSLENALVDQLRDVTGFEWDGKSLKTTMNTISDNTNAVLIAAAEISAEGFASSEANDLHKLDANFGSTMNVQAGWARSKSYAARNPSTGEDLGTRTNFNVMSNAGLQVKGSAGKMISNYSKEFGAGLLGGDDK